jgi:hypothetical protein
MLGLYVKIDLELKINNIYILIYRGGIAHSVLCLTTYWTTGVRSPAETKDFSSGLHVQTGSGAHSVSCPMVTGVLSRG